MHFVSVHMVHLYNSMDTPWKKSCVILLDRIDFYMINRQLIAFDTFTRHILTWFSGNGLLLQRYMKWSTNFRRLPCRVNLAPFCLKHHVLCFICILVRPMLPAAWFRLCNKASTWAGAFMRRIMSSVKSVSVLVSVGYCLLLAFWTWNH